MNRKWWKETVVYQIYPRSFMDANGDGIGDIEGIKERLDYIKHLGIDVIWICPIYKSPNDDNGYDISDYKDILAEFGTMEEFDDLLKKIHQKGMKLIIDLVINHTSDEHPWFIESRSSKNNPYRDYYIWRSGDGISEPNNWESIFGGSVWEYDEYTKEYYMHVFSSKQPDLNWENEKVREEVYDMINWWLDKGIDGFRVDAISHIKKRSNLPNLPNPQNKKFVPSFEGHMNQTGIQKFLKELKEQTFDNYDIMTVGEANGVDVSEANDWVGFEDGKFNMIFQFEHLNLWNQSEENGLDIYKLKNVLTKWQKGLEGVGWNALFLENHDQPRSVSTWGNDKEFWDKSAKCLATLYFLMKGTPFIYQGQEIGMTNAYFEHLKEYNDVATKNFYYHEKEMGKSHEEIINIIKKTSRDNSRTPMQWNYSLNSGFSDGTPWLKVNPNYEKINVTKQIEEKNSIYNYYKELIQIRKNHLTILYGTYDLIQEDHPKVYAYTRTLEAEKILIVTNLFEEETFFTLPTSFMNYSFNLIISNYEEKKNNENEALTLKPYEARVYSLK
ncbi:glycoside hydrolase family 13 protein [Marinococcus halotolerans]|uniref:glycoside hydrolase family 13 protein n=1 Tax=Marinococcus halotolerans TaxID=301092 RepID=UPI0003B63111|nr:alpha-glucosidase [Marinococcus halotolerans]